MAARSGSPFDPRRQLHRFLLVEGPREGRTGHLGDPADRLPVERIRDTRLRTPWLPSRCLLLVVRLLAPPSQVSLRAGRAARDVPRGPPAVGGSGRGLGLDSRGSREGEGVQVAARQGWFHAEQLGRSHRTSRGRPCSHDQEIRPRPYRRLLADSGDVDGLLRGRQPLPLPDRRGATQLLRLVRRPAARFAPGLGRPDRRARVRRLVGRVLPDALGLEHPADAHSRRPLHDRSPLPGPEGHRRLARLRGQHQVRRPVAARHRGDRRRPRNGHGPRDPQGILRRPRSRILR